jgi:hypothetical protein
MSFKPDEIAAYIGAAAWLPQILTWLYNKLSKPKVIIVPDKTAEIGFTRFGPIFNLRMAIASENRDVIINSLEMILTHEDGETRKFLWSGFSETFSEITDEDGRRQVVSRDQTPIALKISTQILTEKFFRFQEPRYHEQDRKFTIPLVEHFKFLKSQTPNDPHEYVKKTLESKELFALTSSRKKFLVEIRTLYDFLQCENYKFYKN